MKKSGRQIAMALIIIVMAIMSVVGMFFPYVHVDVNAGIFGRGTATLNGFICFSSTTSVAFQDCASIAYIYSWIHFGLSALLLVICLIRVFSSFEDFVEGEFKLILFLILSVGYLIVGIVCMSKVDKSFKNFASTLSFLLIIIQVLLFIAYLICSKLIPEKDTKQNSMNMQNNYGSPYGNNNRGYNNQNYYQGYNNQNGYANGYNQGYNNQGFNNQGGYNQGYNNQGWGNQYYNQPVYPQPQPVAPVQKAEPPKPTEKTLKLQTCKNLLDSGKITMEEYEEKVNKILSEN